MKYIIDLPEQVTIADGVINIAGNIGWSVIEKAVHKAVPCRHEAEQGEDCREICSNFGGRDCHAETGEPQEDCSSLKLSSKQGADKGEQGVREARYIVKHHQERHSNSRVPQNYVGLISVMRDMLHEIDSHPTPDKAVEPLEELIKRKGVGVCIMVGNAAEMMVFKDGAKARAYLEGLADKEGV